MSAPGMKITNFHYSHMKMPDGPGGYVEYPKWIHMPGYPSQIVETAQEEEILRARPEINAPVAAPAAAPKAETPAVAVPAPTKILSGVNDEREILLQIAKEKNIKVDARWKTDRLRATIERETAHL